MKTKYEWMNDGKEFELPDFNQMNPQQQLDLLHLKFKAEKDYADIKPKGIRPKQKDLTREWIVYLNMVSKQGNIDMVVYALQTIDPESTKETILKHLEKDEDIVAIVNQLFREGKIPLKNKRKTGEPQKKKS